MNSKIFNLTDKLPETSGIFIFLNNDNHSLYAGIAENFRINVKAALAKNVVLREKTIKIEIFSDSGNGLIKNYARAIRREKPLYNLSIAGQNLYPHFKITKETYPRLLISRRIEDDEAEYFGGFLPETGARFLLGFLIETFRLRGCVIPIDGSFPVPCPQFYRKKCVAPCVENLCDKKTYWENVTLARLFLEQKQAELNEILLKKIHTFSEKLDFETSAKIRDFLENINAYFEQKNRQYWLNETVDTFEIESDKSQVLVRLVTQRKRKILGKRTYEFENAHGFSKREIIEQLLWQFYQFHTPGEIIVPFDFPSRKFLRRVLSGRSGSNSKISIVTKSKQKKTTGRALKRTEFEHAINSLKNQISIEEIQRQLQQEFLLKKLPERIEAFDVAHISGVDFVGAKSVWENGRFIAEEYEFWFLDEKSELAALEKTIENRFIKDEYLPDLILIDGGKSQLRAALKAMKNKEIPVISAVKPQQKHNEISYFLLEDGSSIKFNQKSPGFQVLLKLRDEAHRIANYIHRTKRETVHFAELFGTLPFLKEKERYNLLQKYGSLSNLRNIQEKELINNLGAKKGSQIFRKLLENKQIEPFIVSIRYDDPNGEAENLQPLFSA